MFNLFYYLAGTGINYQPGTRGMIDQVNDL